jgi:hypothetical protein
MTIRSMVNMMDATRVTRQGRLEEALAVLRGAPSATDWSATACNSGPDADTQQANAGASTFLDKCAPRACRVGRGLTGREAGPWQSRYRPTAGD